MDIDLQTLNETVVRKSEDRTIQSNIRFTNNVKVGEHVNINGLVNGLDLSEFDRSSPMLQPELDDLEKTLNDSLNNQCQSLTYIKESLKGNVLL